MKFTYDAYASLIQTINKNGYTITDYHNYKNAAMPVILRHDVDSSLEKALQLARLENELGVRSTYFVLVTSDFYNIASSKSREKIREIRELGHEIGLHFDETSYDISDDERWEKKIKEHIFNEIDVMEKIIGGQIRTVSMHRPSSRTLETDLTLDDVINSYGKKFFNDFKYISDSRRYWREDAESIIKSQEYKKLHILTHAFWYNDIEKNICESIVEFVNGANMERYFIQKENIREIDEIMKVEEVVK